MNPFFCYARGSVKRVEDTHRGVILVQVLTSDDQTVVLMKAKKNEPSYKKSVIVKCRMT